VERGIDNFLRAIIMRAIVKQAIIRWAITRWAIIKWVIVRWVIAKWVIVKLVIIKKLYRINYFLNKLNLFYWLGITMLIMVIIFVRLKIIQFVIMVIIELQHFLMFLFYK